MTQPALPSYSSGTSDAPLLGDTIGGNLERTVATHGGREALVDVPSGRRWTYRELLTDVDALAKGLLAKGVLKDGVGTLTADEVRDFATGKLAHYKIPRYVHVTEAFPMTVTGKVRKVEMREQAVEILRP
ncbi:hypothetical protein DUHN55_43500 [Helicobacter pylori]